MTNDSRTYRIPGHRDTRVGTSAHSLSNLAATRTGQVHYMTYIPQGDGDVAVLANDCIGERIEVMSCEAARADYAGRKADGWVVTHLSPWAENIFGAASH